MSTRANLDQLPEDVIEIIIIITSSTDPPQELYSREDRHALRDADIHYYSDDSHDYDDEYDEESEQGSDEAQGQEQDTTFQDDEELSDTCEPSRHDSPLDSDENEVPQVSDAEGQCIDDSASDTTNGSYDEICYACGQSIYDCIQYEDLSYYGDRRVVVVNRCRGAILYKKSLSRKDILNLRITNRSLSNRLIEWFRRDLPGCRAIRTGELSVSPDYRHLQGIATSCTRQIIASHITTLEFKVGPITQQSIRRARNVCETVGDHGKLFLEPLNSDWLQRFWNQAQTLTSEVLEQQYVKLSNQYVEQEWAAAVGDDVKPLARIFSHLPNLREIRMGPVTSAFKQAESCEIRRKAFETVIKALALHPIPIQGLVAHSAEYWPSDEEMGIWALDIPQPMFTVLNSSFATLKKVHLSLSTGNYLHMGPNTTIKRNIAPVGFTMEKAQKTLLHFLSAMPLLESLHLLAAADNDVSLSFIRKILRGLPNAIKVLHLSSMFMSVPILSNFFDAHRHQLTEIGLTRLCLTDESWMPVVRMMNVYLPQLNAVYLEQLWELHPGFSDKLFFFPPRGYYGACNGSLGRRIYTIGRGRRRPGHYVEGWWVPDYRCDAMIMRDGSTHGMVQGVRNGLTRTIRGGFREAVQYGSRRVDDPLPQKVLDHICEKFGLDREEIQRRQG